MSKLESPFCGMERERWIIMRDGTEIFCGLARNYTFKPVAEIGNAAVKTYLSKAKAISAFESRRHIKFDNDRYEVVRIVESYRPHADNPPLTLAELRETEGEIVYVRGKSGNIANFLVDISCPYQWLRCPRTLFLALPNTQNYGKAWLAYRHKPE